MEENMDAVQAAARLGVPAAEVTAVRDTEHGQVVTTTDGFEYLVNEGGVSYWQRGPKATTFPVFVPPAEDTPAEEAAAGDDDKLPEGPVPAILKWVGDDPQRAAQALAVEQARGESARSTLVATLEKLAG